jgi:hypothetical protein
MGSGEVARGRQRVAHVTQGGASQTGHRSFLCLILRPDKAIA